MVDTYRIFVGGHLDDRWSDWLAGLVIQRQEDGTTLLVGPVVDQAALHGVLARIRDLGLPLLGVDREVASPVRREPDVQVRGAKPTQGGGQ
ncbi:MAG: hypothetical protein M3464_01780 [Chloroflexota bacterium]|jgi:hypothetical protein|nr:hypothetical protein [Chloroflexota bacterium]